MSAVQFPSIKGVRLPKMTRILNWLKSKFASERKKCIKIDPTRTWPRQSHENK